MGTRRPGQRPRPTARQAKASAHLTVRPYVKSTSRIRLTCNSTSIARANNNASKPKHTLHDDNHDIPTSLTNTSDESGVSADEEHESVARLPSSGELILNTALAKAIEQYEDKETTKLVKKEWEVVDDDDGESLGSSGKKGPWVGRKGKGTVIPAEDQEYEFV